MEVTDGVWGYIVLCMMSFLTISNPLGVMPMYMTLTNGMTHRLKMMVIKKSILASIITLLLFSFLGPLIFKLFGISEEGFRIIGGIIFFNIGFGMLNDTGSRRNTKLVKNHEIHDETHETDNISIIPLAIPVLCGPGIMTNGIILRQHAHTDLQVFLLVACVFVFYFFVGFVLKASEKIKDWLGDTGMKVMSRIMGLILMVIAAEFIIGGLTPILKDIISAAIKSAMV